MPIAPQTLYWLVRGLVLLSIVQAVLLYFRW